MEGQRQKQKQAKKNQKKQSERMRYLLLLILLFSTVQFLTSRNGFVGYHYRIIGNMIEWYSTSPLSSSSYTQVVIHDGKEGESAIATESVVILTMSKNVTYTNGTLELKMNRSSSFFPDKSNYNNNDKGNDDDNNDDNDDDDDNDNDDDNNKEDWFNYERWWNKRRTYKGKQYGNYEGDGIFPYETCHYVEDICRISTLSSNNHNENEHQNYYKGWIYNPYIVGTNNSYNQHNNADYLSLTRTQRKRKQTHRVAHPIINFWDNEGHRSDNDFLSDDISFFNSGNEWDIDYFDHIQNSSKSKLIMPSQCTYGTTSSSPSSSTSPTSTTTINNHFILYGSYSYMLGEFYSRIMSPLVELIHFMLLVHDDNDKKNINNDDNDNDPQQLSSSPPSWSNNSSTLFNSSLSSSNITTITMMMKDVIMMEKFRKQTKFYLSGIGGSGRGANNNNNNHEQVRRSKLLESHHAFLGLYSDHPIMTSLELGQHKMIGEKKMNTNEEQRNECSCLKRLFFCGYKNIKKNDIEGDSIDDSPPAGGDVPVRHDSQHSYSPPTGFTKLMPIGVIPGEFDSGFIKQMIHKQIIELSTTTTMMSMSMIPLVVGVDNSNNETRTNYTSINNGTDNEGDRKPDNNDDSLKLLIREYLIGKIKDIDVVKDVGNDADNNTNDIDTDTDNTHDNDNGNDSSNVDVGVRGNAEKEEEEEEEKRSNWSPAIVLSDRLQLLNKIDDKTTTQASTTPPQTMPPPTTMPTITPTVRKNHSIVHMLVKGDNDDDDDDDDSYFDDFRKEWKIIGITQRSDRRIWLNHDEIMEECYKRYSNMKYKLLCVSIDIGGQEFRNNPPLHIATHNSLDVLMGIHGAQLTEGVFMKSGSLVVEIIPFIPDGIIGSDWIRNVESPTPIGEIFTNTDLNHIGLPLTIDSTMHNWCISNIRHKQLRIQKQQQLKRQYVNNKNNKTIGRQQEPEQHIIDIMNNFQASLNECFYKGMNRWDIRNFTVPVNDVMDILEKFVIVYDDDEKSTIATNTTTITTLPTPPSKSCKEYQKLAGNKFVLYNVNCIDDDYDKNHNDDDGNENRMSVDKKNVGQPRQFYRTKQWLESRTNSSLEFQHQQEQQ